ncbi:hypothetical protein DPEC_G00119990 [Dallia pectoralis]|uniref:Uncharacterized protein n=1 Tax=Dallia pectoralis TaxID=75939 RepID=A0ACC2GPR2_DALPE|nr:hypothetical protein DPEC_G00119990 [Dallia pectoralis]
METKREKDRWNRGEEEEEVWFGKPLGRLQNPARGCEDRLRPGEVHRLGHVWTRPTPLCLRVVQKHHLRDRLNRATPGTPPSANEATRHQMTSQGEKGNSALPRHVSMETGF